MSNLGLIFLILRQLGNSEDDIWEIVTTDKGSYENVIEAINSGASEDIESALDNMDIIDTLSDGLDIEGAREIAFQYADQNPVTIIVSVPNMM